MLGKQFSVDSRLVVESFQIASGDQLDEVLVARHVFGQKRDVASALIAAVLIRLLEPAPRSDVHLAADDRLHTLLHREGVEVDRAEEVPVISDGQGRHPVFLGFGDQRLQCARPVQQAILAVDVQVDKIGMVHDTSGKARV